MSTRPTTGKPNRSTSKSTEPEDVHQQIANEAMLLVLDFLHGCAERDVLEESALSANCMICYALARRCCPAQILENWDDYQRFLDRLLQLFVEELPGGDLARVRH